MMAPEPLVDSLVDGQHTSNEVSARDLFSLDRRCIIGGYKKLLFEKARLMLGIVTGATGGMGVQVVKAILQSGADVIGVDRDEVPKTSYWSKPNLLGGL